MRLGKPEKTQIIEFGPGRGTLMSDMLRVRNWEESLVTFITDFTLIQSLSHFPYFYKTITDVHLIEASTGLRKLQREALVKGSEDKDVTRIKGNEREASYETITREDGVKVSWYDGIELIPGMTGISSRWYQVKIVTLLI